MKKIMILLLVLIMSLSFAACSDEEASTPAGDNNASAPAAAPEGEEWPYKDVTAEQIQSLADIISKLEPLYNEAVVAAKENGWESDETTVNELNTVYACIEAAKAGIADPSEYEGTTDMDAVVQQYQAFVDAMPDIITRVSEAYSK